MGAALLASASIMTSAMAAPLQTGAQGSASALAVTPAETLERQGLTVMVDQNQFSPIFFDEKNAGIQIVPAWGTDRHRRCGTAQSHARAMGPPVPAFVSRTRGTEPNQIIVRSAYKDQKLAYRVKVTAEGDGFRIAVDLDQPLPAALVGKAGFNLDFLPTRYFGKTYLMDSAPGLFPRHPHRPDGQGRIGRPMPLASGGKSITLVTGRPLTRVTITSDAGGLALYDARKPGAEWLVRRTLADRGRGHGECRRLACPPQCREGLGRPPVVSFNQAGYTPGGRRSR